MSKNIKFRKLKSKDWKDMFEYGSDPEVTKYLKWDTYKTVDDAISANKKLRKEKTHHLFAIIVHGKMVGTCTLMNIDVDKETIKVSCALNKNFWGMGVGTQALTHIMNVAHAFYKGYTLWSTVNSKNISSISLLKKCGFIENKKKSNTKNKYYSFKA